MVDVIDDFDVRMSDQDSDYLFDSAIKVFLTKQKDYKRKAIKLFVKSYINDKKIPIITIGKILKEDEKLQALTKNENAVYFKFDFLTENKTIVRDICYLFHELEHCNTGKLNSTRQFFNNEKYFSYSYSEDDKDSDLLYYASANELKSRQAEITYAQKFYERAENIILNDAEYNTPENIEFLNSIKQQFEFKQQAMVSFYKILNKHMSSKSTIWEFKLKATKFLNNIKFFYKNYNEFKANILFSKVRSRIVDNALWLAGYISIYGDQKILEKILNFAKHGGEWTYIWENIDDYICSSKKVYNEKQLNKFFLEYNYGRCKNHDASHFDPKLLARFTLLFNKPMHFYNQEQENEYKTEKLRIRQKYLIKGIPYFISSNYKYKTRINGKVYSFKSLDELYIKALDYIDSSALIDLDDEKIERINKIFDSEIIEQIDATPKIKQAQVKNSNNYDLGNEMM